MSRPVGAVGDVRAITDEVRQIAEKVKSEAEQKAQSEFSEYEPVQFCSQVVAGTNFFIKVKTGGEEYVHLKIFRDLKQVVSLTGIQSNKTVEDPLKYF